MGYHRLHTHRGFKTYQAVRVLPRRLRHADARGRADLLGRHPPRCIISTPTSRTDPHTPRVSGFWAHIGWILFGEAHHNDTARMSRYAPDLAQGSVLPLADHLSLGAADRARLRACSRSAAGALVNWAIFLRVVVGLHSTWLVNSATHMWGRRRFATQGRLAQHLVGRAADVRRRLAQQPSRPPDLGAPRPGLVRVRRHLARAEGAEGARARLGRPRRPDQPGARGRDRRLAPFAAILEGVRRA